MSVRLSRRKLASYYAASLADGMDPQELVCELAAFLIDTKRVGELSLIVRDIEYYLSQAGIVVANVTTARNLTSAMRTAINQMIHTQTESTSIELREFVDPSVIGGALIDLPGARLDGTVARQLTLLRTNYKQ